MKRLPSTGNPKANLFTDPDSPLLSPLSKYPIPGRFVIAPYWLDQVGIAYLEKVGSAILEPSLQFVYITRFKGHDDQFKPWLTGYLAGKGFTATALYISDAMSATLFKKSQSR